MVRKKNNSRVVAGIPVAVPLNCRRIALRSAFPTNPAFAWPAKTRCLYPVNLLRLQVQTSSLLRCLRRLLRSTPELLLALQYILLQLLTNHVISRDRLKPL